MADFKNYKRLVIKVGTSTLTEETGKLNFPRIEKLVKVISSLKDSGKEVVLVTSGAIGIGVSKLGLSRKGMNIPQKQAAAAIGQCELMNIYKRSFGQYEKTVAQILLTRDILDNAERKENVVNTFNTLLGFGAVPIVNENDTVSIEELNVSFGENDTLSAVVSVLTHSDLLIILSDIEGLYDKDPHEFKDAKLIPEVNRIDDSIRALAGGKGTNRGTGGMVAKLSAAEIVMAANIPMIIANGGEPDILFDIVQGKSVGTIFDWRE